MGGSDPGERIMKMIVIRNTEGDHVAALIACGEF